MTDTPPRKPSAFDIDLATALCRQVADGLALAQVCRAPDMPDEAAVLAWEAALPAFAAMLESARRRGEQMLAADLAAEQIISRDYGKDMPPPRTYAEQTERMRVQIRARQWLMARWNPEVYGPVEDIFAGDHDDDDGRLSLDDPEFDRADAEAQAEAEAEAAARAAARAAAPAPPRPTVAIPSHRTLH